MRTFYFKNFKNFNIPINRVNDHLEVPFSFFKYTCGSNFFNWLKFLKRAWFDITRRDAERQLLWPSVPEGTFLIRPCSTPTEGKILIINFHII